VWLPFIQSRITDDRFWISLGESERWHVWGGTSAERVVGNLYVTIQQF
jgi:hypothetical protein